MRAPHGLGMSSIAFVLATGADANKQIIVNHRSRGLYSGCSSKQNVARGALCEIQWFLGCGAKQMRSQHNFVLGIKHGALFDWTTQVFVWVAHHLAVQRGVKNHNQIQSVSSTAATS